MKNSSFEKLKNPPIKETVIGIGINNYFSGDLKNTIFFENGERDIKEFSK